MYISPNNRGYRLLCSYGLLITSDFLINKKPFYWLTMMFNFVVVVVVLIKDTMFPLIAAVIISKMFSKSLCQRKETETRVLSERILQPSIIITADAKSVRK